MTRGAAGERRMAGSAVAGQVGEHYFEFDLLGNNVRGEGRGNELQQAG